MTRIIRDSPQILKHAISRALRVRALFGKGVTSQALEILRYYFGRGRLGPSDYYDYRLFDDQHYTAPMKSEFVGWRMERWLDNLLNGCEWRGAANDKLQFYALMRANGFGIPQLYAILHPLGRTIAATPSFCDLDSLAGFLRTGMTYPVFAKPAHSASAQGTHLVLDYSTRTDALTMYDGEEIPVSQFLDNLVDPRRSGYLFLEYLRPHANIRDVCGDRLSTVRLVILVDEDGPRAFRAVWKIQTGENIFDNFGLVGETGNLCAAVNVANGRVERVIGRVGIDQTVHEKHPDTGEALLGFELPCWQELLTSATAAALVYPKLHFQHWDIALTNRGVVMLECNVSGGVGIPQLASRRGLYDARLRDLVKRAKRE